MNYSELLPRIEEVTLHCSRCGETIVILGPSRVQLDEPLCPLCSISTYEFVSKLLGYKENKI